MKFLPNVKVKYLFRVSDTPDTDVYFTLDGRNPEPFATLGTAKSTQKYKWPFCLPAGTVSVKAKAVDRRTGKESLMITRTYQVSETSNASLTNNYDITSIGSAHSAVTFLLQSTLSASNVCVEIL